MSDASPMRPRRSADDSPRSLAGTLLVGGLLVAALVTSSPTAIAAGSEHATFAGGCFWCVESDFDSVPGVVETVSGYTGGTTKNPTYKQVTYSDTGHREAVRVTFDPAEVTYAELVEVFWRSVDPTDGGGQFCDRGKSYTTAIFTHSDDQAATVAASREALEAAATLGAPNATSVEPAGEFYPAEDYHQDYYQKNPVRYRIYRFGCGRDARVTELWGADAHRGIEKH